MSLISNQEKRYCFMSCSPKKVNSGQCGCHNRTINLKNTEKMNLVNVNGNFIQGSGNIVITKGRILFGGKDITPDEKEITIEITGDVDKLEVDACIKISVNGSVKTIKTMSGNVDVTGDVDGDIKTMSGDIECGHVQGSVSTMSGDIKNKK